MLTGGLGTLPVNALYAMLIAAGIGLLLGAADVWLPEKRLRFVPSASAMGLAFVIPASTSLGLFYGAALALLLKRFTRLRVAWIVAAAAGLVAGESLVGVALALLSMAR